MKKSIYKGGDASVSKIPRFWGLLESKFIKSNDFREEGCVLGSILVEQKNFHCKQTADCLLYCSVNSCGGFGSDDFLMLMQYMSMMVMMIIATKQTMK